MNELKPCPFCGASGEINKRQIGFAVLCINEVCGNAFTNWHNSKVDAINQWNTRADGWVRIEDELPQEDFQVLACCDDDVEACVFRMHDTGNYYFERVDGDFRLEATHWMPLPVPPKAVK